MRPLIAPAEQKDQNCTDDEAQQDQPDGQSGPTSRDFNAASMLKRRANTRLTRQQQLASRPLRTVDAQMIDGKLKVKLKQPRWSGWFFRLPKDASKTFEFDQLGQLVWNLCDGQHSVQQIARKLAKTYSISERESQVATEKFLTTLASKGLIAAVVKDAGSETK